jgi:hypothetical protein
MRSSVPFSSRPRMIETFAAFVLLATSGCQQYVRIAWDVPRPVEVNEKTMLAVGDLAVINRDPVLYESHPSDAVIGKHTFTVFAIPVGNICTHPSTPLKASFDRAVRDALGAAGYDLVEASEAPADTPVLRGEVNACWWWSYTWLWPLVVQGGENKVTLYLERRDGTLLWKREFSRIEPGLVPFGAFAFDLMVKWSMTKLVQDIVRATSSDDFKAALLESQHGEDRRPM